MAKITPYNVQDLMKKLEQLGQLDEIAPKMLDAATPIGEAAIRKRLRPHNKTMHLLDSVKRDKAKKNKNGIYNAMIRFKGYDKKQAPTEAYPRGVPNSVKAAGLEFGNSHQPARPFLQASLNDCEQEVAAQLQATYNQEVKK